jgi:hypothetical protein
MTPNEIKAVAYNIGRNLEHNLWPCSADDAECFCATECRKRGIEDAKTIRVVSYLAMNYVLADRESRTV